MKLTLVPVDEDTLLKKKKKFYFMYLFIGCAESSWWLEGFSTCGAQA